MASLTHRTSSGPKDTVSRPPSKCPGPQYRFPDLLLKLLDLFVLQGFLILGPRPEAILADEHEWVSLEGLRHRVYDRFFTRIEQRLSRNQIMALRDTFAKVTISDDAGYWDFLCEKDGGDGPSRKSQIKAPHLALSV